MSGTLYGMIVISPGVNLQYRGNANAANPFVTGRRQGKSTEQSCQSCDWFVSYLFQLCFPPQFPGLGCVGTQCPCS